MTPESRDKLDSTLTPRLLNLTLESEMSENSLMCVTSDGWPSIYSSCRSVLRLMLSFNATSLVEVTSTRSWAREAAKWGRPASPRPASLGFAPLGTVLLLDVPDALLVSVAVALVWGLIVRGRSDWPRRILSLCFADLWSTLVLCPWRRILGFFPSLACRWALQSMGEAFRVIWSNWIQVHGLGSR
jgi:hypothetical protein